MHILRLIVGQNSWSVTFSNPNMLYNKICWGYLFHLLMHQTSNKENIFNESDKVLDISLQWCWFTERDRDLCRLHELRDLHVSFWSYYSLRSVYASLFQIALVSGFLSTFVQVLPSASISYFVYELMKIVLKVEWIQINWWAYEASSNGDHVPW